MYVHVYPIVATEAARQSVRCELGIEYAEPGGPRLDIYHPSTSPPDAGGYPSTAHPMQVGIILAPAHPMQVGILAPAHPMQVGILAPAHPMQVGIILAPAHPMQVGINTIDIVHRDIIPGYSIYGDTSPSDGSVYISASGRCRRVDQSDLSTGTKF